MKNPNVIEKMTTLIRQSCKKIRALLDIPRPAYTPFLANAECFAALALLSLAFLIAQKTYLESDEPIRLALISLNHFLR